MRSPSRFPRALAALALCSLLASGLAAQDTELATEDQKILYAVGLVVAQNLSQLGLDAQELEIVHRGIADSVLGRTPQVDLQTYGPKLGAFVQARASAQAELEKGKSAEFLQAAAGEAGAETSDSGLVYREIEPGDGANPAADDTVKVHYHGKLRDGKVFDSSVDRGEPVQFSLSQVIPCWTEGVQKMKVGGKSRLVCPSTIAYGDQGRPGIPPGAALDFEVELIEIVPAEGS